MTKENSLFLFAFENQHNPEKKIYSLLIYTSVSTNGSFISVVLIPDPGS